MATSAKQAEKRAQDMERFLAYLAQGNTIRASMMQIGRHPSTYLEWKKVSPDFRSRADAILGRRLTLGHAKIGNARPDDTDGPNVHTFEGHRKRYFGYETYGHQRQMVEAVENALPGTTTMILLPPEWMKSTTLCDFICKVIGEDPNHRFCYLTESLGLSKKVAGRIQRRMTDRAIAADFIDDFGPFKAPEREMQKVWNKLEFTVLRSTHDESDYTFECRGSTSNIYGSRYDDIVLDDIQSRKSATPARSEHLLDLYRSDWRTRVLKSGRIFIIGTRVAPGDFYELMLRNNLVDNLVMIPALDKAGKSNFPAVYDADGGRVVTDRGDPLGWSEEELARRREEVGEDVWWRVYMQTGRASGVGPFPDAAIERAYDVDRGPGSMGKHATLFGRIGGVDPALGGVAGFCVCSYDADTLYVEEVRGEPNLQRTEEIFSIVEQMTIEHLPDEWVWDTRGLQKGFARDDDNVALRERYGFVITEHTTGEERLIDDKIGIPSMASALRRGEIRLPGNDEGRFMVAGLVEQMLAWRQDIPKKMLKQDILDALWYCYLRWQQLREALDSDLSAFDRTASPTFTAYQTTIGGWR